MAGVTEATLSYRSTPIWARARVLKHDHSFLSNARDESSSTCFSQACWGLEPNLPLIMLKYGTDPGVGRFGHMSNLNIAMKC